MGEFLKLSIIPTFFFCLFKNRKKTSDEWEIKDYFYIGKVMNCKEREHLLSIDQGTSITFSENTRLSFASYHQTTIFIYNISRDIIVYMYDQNPSKNFTLPPLKYIFYEQLIRLILDLRRVS